MMSSDKPSLNTRWLQRFEHFERAYTLLTEAISLSKTRPLSNLEAEGAIQRFEYTLELAWKTLKDYLEANNVVFSAILPRTVIKQAIASKIITEHHQAWLNALDARNKLSHVYEQTVFIEALHDIQHQYIPALESFYQTFCGYRSNLCTD